MALLSNLKPEQRFIGLFVGRSGNGKTSAICSFPGPIKVLDFDERIQGALGCPWLAPKFKDVDYTVFPPIEPKGTEANYIRLNKMLEGFHGQGTSIPYKTIVLDSLTSTARALLRNAIPISNAGRKIGQMQMAGPGDYGFESQGIDNILSFFRSLPIQNVIVTAHVVPKMAKPKDDNGEIMQYAESIEIGEKLSVRDKIGENSLIYFDHILKFNRRETATRMIYEVVFRSDLARTSLDRAPMSEDITGKDFYDQVLMKYMRPADQPTN